MKARLFLFSMFLLIPVLALAGCNSQSSGGSEKAKDKETHSHEDMNHSGSSEVPKGLKKAENPTYKVGSDVMILASHMKGMKNAQGTVKVLMIQRFTVYLTLRKREESASKIINGSFRKS